MVGGTQVPRRAAVGQVRMLVLPRHREEVEVEVEDGVLLVHLELMDGAQVHEVQVQEEVRVRGGAVHPNSRVVGTYRTAALLLLRWVVCMITSTCFLRLPS